MLNLKTKHCLTSILEAPVQIFDIIKYKYMIFCWSITTWRTYSPCILKLVYTYINYRVLGTKAAAIFHSNDHSLCAPISSDKMECLISFVNSPTRKVSILDVFITKRPTLVKKSINIPDLWDHDAIHLDSNIIDQCVASSTYGSKRISAVWRKRKRMRSDSVLWQKPLHPQKTQKATWQHKKRHQKLWLHNDCGPTAVIPHVWLNRFRSAQHSY